MSVIPFPNKETFEEFIKELQRVHAEAGPITSMAVMYEVKDRAHTIYLNVEPKDLAMMALLMQQEALDLAGE